MKKLFAAMTAAAMALSLAACGSSASSTPAQSEAASKSESTAAAATGESKWPSDTVSMYVPAKAGGGTDMTGRVFIQGMSEVNGGNYIVVNDVTGGGSVAAETVRNADPDGLNLLMYHTGLCTSIASGQYAHTLDEFTICGMFITVPEEATGALFVPGNSPFNTLEELVDYAKAHPGELMAGMQNGSSTQLIEALFEKAMGIECTMVDAGSNADKVTALMGNQIDYCFMNTTGNDQYVKSGDLKCLVQWGSEGSTRSTIFPDVPLLEEVYPDVDMPRLDMYGYIAGPKGMSEADVAAISETIKGAVETQTVKDGYAKLATTVEFVSPEESVEILKKCQDAYNEAYALANAQ